MQEGGYDTDIFTLVRFNLKKKILHIDELY